MNLKTLMIIGIAAGAVAAMVWLGLKLTQEPPTLAPTATVMVPRAVVSQATGRVEVSPQDSNTARPAAPPAPLNIGDVVTTFGQASADVVFDGNNVVHLGPNTSLVIGVEGGGSAQLGAVLLAGQAKVQTGERNVGFQIGTPVGLVQLPKDKLALVDIRFDEGVKVLTGEVNLVTPKSQVGQVMLSGQEITLSDLRVQGTTSTVDGLTLDVPAPLPPSLAVQARPMRGRVRIKPRAAKSFDRLRAARPLLEGDAVAVGANGSASVALDDVMHLEMGSKARFVLAKTVGGEQPHRAEGTVSGGPAELVIDSAAAQASSKLTVSGAPLTIVPTDKSASVDVYPQGAQSAVYVRFGEAMVGDHDVVHAGEVAIVNQNGLMGAPIPAHPAALQVEPGRATEIHYDQAPPPVRFVLPRAKGPSKPQQPRHMQWAKDGAFQAVTAAEVTHAPAFAHDRIEDGTTFWRTTDAPAAVGALSVARDQAGVCTTCRATTVLPDTGEAVVVRYENVAPNIVLRWNAAPGDAPQTVQIFSNSDLRTPMVTRAVSGGRLELPEQLLEDGSYHWVVGPQGGVQDGQAQTTTPAKTVNSLRIEHEPHTDGLVISAPSMGETSHKGRLVSRGRVALGATLTLNGQRLRVREDGSFRVPVRLRRGANRLVYRVTEPNAPERYYIRDVTFR